MSKEAIKNYISFFFKIITSVWNHSQLRYSIIKADSFNTSYIYAFVLAVFIFLKIQVNKNNEYNFKYLQKCLRIS